MTAHRVDDWRTKLNAHVEANKDRPFEWGQHDCALWAKSCVEVVTGVDLVPGLVGKYSTARGAKQALKTLGAASLLDLATQILGEPKHPAFARAGDVVAMKVSGLDGFKATTFMFALGICTGSVSYFVGEVDGVEGLVPMPTLSVDWCFHG